MAVLSPHLLMWGGVIMATVIVCEGWQLAAFAPRLGCPAARAASAVSHRSLGCPTLRCQRPKRPVRMGEEAGGEEASGGLSDADISGLLARVSAAKDRVQTLPVCVLDATLPRQRLEFATADKSFSALLEHCKYVCMFFSRVQWCRKEQQKGTTRNLPGACVTGLTRTYICIDMYI